MNEKDDLIQKTLRGEALDGLKQHQGWKAFIEILEEVYESAWQELKEKENPVARSKLQALEEIVQVVDMKILLGKESREALKRMTDTE